MEIENLFHYTALAVGLKPSASQGKARLRGLYRIISSKTISPRLAKAKPACAGYGGGNTPHHPCASVISVPIRGLFRLSEAKPACTGATLRVRAEALEHGEAPAGLARGRSCGLKPFLSTWKPLRGYGVLTAESNGQK